MKITMKGIKLVEIPTDRFTREGKFANWRYWEIGDIIKYTFSDFDGSGTLYGKVTKIEDDHLIVHINTFDMNLWVDDDNEKQFERWDW